MEGKLKSEGVKVESVRKESSEQLRLAKAEVKSLTDKIERWVCTWSQSMCSCRCHSMYMCMYVRMYVHCHRMKKDITKKDSHYENKSRQFRTEMFVHATPPSLVAMVCLLQ